MKRLLSIAIMSVLLVNIGEVANAKDYVVEDGDVLWKIAETNNTTVAAIAEANSIKDYDLIHVGDMLELPEASTEEKVKLKWQTVGFSQPESVLSIPGHDWLYVSNINGEEVGYVSRMAKDGSVDNYRWAEGIQTATGMGYFDGMIYVANTSDVKVIDINTGEVVKTITSPEAMNLNDITVSADGRIFVSDVVAEGRIFLIEDGVMTTFIASEQFSFPNGLYVEGNTLYVGNLGKELRFDGGPDTWGALHTVDMISKEIAIVDGTEYSGQYDGIATLGDKMLVTFPTTGTLGLVTSDGIEVLTSIEGWSADLFVDASINMIYVPQIFADGVVAYEYTEADKDYTTVRLVMNGMLSNSHNIEEFQMPVTNNYLPESDENINNLNYEALSGHLSMTGIVTIDGEVAGIATETEIVYMTDKGTQANSVWMVKLNYPGLTGFFSVEQIERAYLLDAEVAKMLALSPEEISTFYSEVAMTTPGTTIQYASGDLASYEGGIFTEYNAIGGNEGGMILEINLAK